MRAALLSLCLVFLVGCKVKNPNFCEDNPQMLCDQPDAGGMDCDNASDCTNDPVGNVCKMPEGKCVQCTATEATACTGTTPICNVMTSTCRSCTKHADCPMSDACLSDGSCALPDQVLYVDGSVSNTMMCTKAMPCGNVLDALAITPPTKSLIRVKGTVQSATIAIDDRDITFLGDPKTSILMRTSGDVLTVDGTSKVRLYDIAIANAGGNNGIHALSGHTGDLELQRCLVTNNGMGILYAGAGTFTLRRSEVSLNINSGGISVTGVAKFDITNTFIFRNGNSSTSNVGGFSYPNGTTPAGSRFEFNTVVENQAQTGASRSGGVFCDITGGFAVPNNLIAKNLASGTATDAVAQKNGSCVFTGSVAQNDFANILFSRPDSMPYDYHLKVGSTAAVDTATTGTLMVDFDGEARPNGTARDMGADELH